MYKEKAATISSLILNLSNLDYPKEKLEILLIVEDDDNETLNHIVELRPERHFKIIKVPFCKPRTKPKACNYAIRYATGDFVTIYDAEDRPEKLQLKKAIAAFCFADNNLVCVQARLNFFNKSESVITRMFALEYGAWFDFMLPALARLKMPIPLGGTSNHFRMNVVKKLYAWDAFNVTEDADLGLRLARHGYKTAMIDSLTLEEAPIKFIPWLKQRTRWIKGYIQTYLVHLRSFNQLVNAIKLHGLIGVVFFVAAPSIIYISLPIVFLLTIASIFGYFPLPIWFMNFAIINLYGGIAVHVLMAHMVVNKLKWWNFTPYCLIFPFYWILHCIASFRAVYQMFNKPHHWEKTEHGVTSFIQND
jgi:glycosyltransferase XagB